MDSPLKPPETIGRLLISSPTRFTGEFGNDEVLITHAWDTENAHYSLGHQEGPYTRHYFVVSLAQEPFDRKTIVIPTRPQAEATCDAICIAMTVLFGKRFEMHGSLQVGGSFYRPPFGASRPLVNVKSPPYNFKPRVDLEIPLMLNHFDKVLPILAGYSAEQPVPSTFFAAARFYHRFMMGFDTEPEVAFLDLITALEIISNNMEFTEAELYDPATLSELEAIKEKIGEKVSKKIKERLYQVKRKYLLAVHRLLTESFFTVTEAEEHEGKFHLEPRTSPMFKDGKSEMTFLRRIKAAYDLRSKYVHGGSKFGWGVAQRGETHGGKPSIRDKEVEDLVYLAPTMYGMERIVRYCLLRYVHLRGFPIDPKLDGPGLPDPGFGV
jgi:Apea-like HEPN